MSDKFKVSITQWDTGCICVAVYNVMTKERAGLHFIDGFPFESQESKFKRAHKWADKYVANLEKYSIDEVIEYRMKNGDK